MQKLVPLDHVLICVNQNDVVRRRFLDPEHRAYVPDFGAYIELSEKGKPTRYMAVSRQMVLFCVERRKAWRMLQSKSGITNVDYKAQRVVIEKLDKGDLSRADVHARGREILEAEVDGLVTIA